jgi:hypothetical protein
MTLDNENSTVAVEKFKMLLYMSSLKLSPEDGQEQKTKYRL